MTIYFDKDHNAYGDKLSIREDDIIFICEDSLWEDFNMNPKKYIWVDDKIVDNPNWEEEKEKQEKARILELSMTRSDFFDGMIMAFGLDSKELRVIVENVLNSINITPVQIRVALNNYDNALNFYRKHTLFELINGVEIPVNETMYLLFTPDIWDKFFDTKNYKELQKAIHEVEPEPDEGGVEEEPVVEDDNIEESEGL